MLPAITAIDLSNRSHKEAMAALAEAFAPGVSLSNETRSSKTVERAR
jgi:hypothetical protein